MSHFFFFILALFVLAALLRIDFFFTIVYLFAGVYLLIQFWSRRMLGQLRVSRLFPERAFTGDVVEVRLRIENRGRLPIPWLMYTESFPIELSSPPFIREVISLAGMASHRFSYRLVARQRGYYSIGPLALQAGDLLGLKRDLASRIEAMPLIVYPKIIPIAELGLPTHSPQVTLATPLPLFLDPARLMGAHDYQPGDNPRFIHWPATAAAGRLLVKQFQPAIARNNAIFLNLDRQEYAQLGYPKPSIELAIVVAASLANHMLTLEKLPVGLVTTAMDPLVEAVRPFNLPPRKGRAQLIQILEVLARVQAVEETRFLESLRRDSVHLTWGTTLTIITAGTESAELLQTLLLLKRAGFLITLVLIQSARRAGTRDAGNRAREIGVTVFEIRQEKEVEQWSPTR